MNREDIYIVFVDESGGASPRSHGNYFALSTVFGSEKADRDATLYVREILKKNVGGILPDVHELHAKDLVNPSKGSTWKKVPLSLRVKILKEFLDKAIELGFSTVTILINKKRFEKYRDVPLTTVTKHIV